MKTLTWVVVGACYALVILGRKRLWDGVAPRRYEDVRHPSEVWESIEDVDSLDGGKE